MLATRIDPGSRDPAGMTSGEDLYQEANTMIKQYPYDPRSGGYILARQGVSAALQSAYDEFRRLPRGSIVADLGSGGGRLAINAPSPDERSYTFCGFDIDQNAVDQFGVAVEVFGLPDRAVCANIANGLDLARYGIRAAISWRVLHGLRKVDQHSVCSSVCRAIPVGAPFFVAVCSESDWKCEALGSGYRPRELNDVGAIMSLGRSFLVDFFNESDLLELAAASGFNVSHIGSFEESTGFTHLAERGHPTNEYLYAHFVKRA